MIGNSSNSFTFVTVASASSNNNIIYRKFYSVNHQMQGETISKACDSTPLF